MPAVTVPEIYDRASSILRFLYGERAEFRQGQYEAIEAVMTQRRTLVVQRTGWGKSLVYFLCTKLMRERGKGVTMVISPLLVLMQNQLQAAHGMGLVCEVLNGTVKDRREEILNALVRDELDLLLITPETLFSPDVQARLKDIRIGLFVIDEAHCISDWGHDFRLEYGNLKAIIGQLPISVPILATTATANDRVVEDLKRQLGDRVFISRGPLTRETLSIQILPMSQRIERYAWLLEYIPQLPGSGIIYCLTQRDCDHLSEFLRQNGIVARAYYSRDGEEGEALNREIEAQFQKNEIKAIVATIKLGMGYDKGDIAFVVHFQMPPNVVSYYQQIGRAGRNIDRAYAILMHGKEDEDILNYFIQTAFPTEEETTALVRYIGSNNGVRQGQIDAAVNMRRGRRDKALSFLIHDGFIRKENGLYYMTAKPFQYDREHYAQIKEIRIREMEQMKQLLYTKECYSRFVTACLDDEHPVDCGRCANCLGYELIPSQVRPENLQRAAEYLDGLILPIKPRKMWAGSERVEGGRIVYLNEPGLCLSKYGDAGYGELVKRDKYGGTGLFREELVGKSVNLLRPFIAEHQIKAVTSVPSLRSGIVTDFSRRLAERLGLPFVETLKKLPAQQQKTMENSAHQCANAYDSFQLIPGVPIPQRLLLVDDVVDSGWTLTVCGYRLREAGCEAVYPYALADSKQREG